MDSSLNLVFCGTPRFAVPTLEALGMAGFRVQLVVTQPDRPRGRGMELAFSAVKESALRLGLPVMQPEKIKHNEDFRVRLSDLHPDAIVVVGYGRIVPQWMLDIPRFGNINLHASMLPKYRGAAPIQWAIARGESVTGVTTMAIDAGLDTGDILLQKQIAIEPQDTSETLGPRLAMAGADLMIETLLGLTAGSVRRTQQDSAKATLAPILTKEDGRMDFSRTAPENLNRLRGFQPWPGAYTTFRGKPLNVWQAQPSDARVNAAELFVDHDRLIVGCAHNTSLELLEVQPEGKKRMPAKAFIQGYRPKSGDRLG
ncbi:MAG TPA: methionyl-tRNA formyltransferase [Terriglobales bacterium]